MSSLSTELPSDEELLKLTQRKRLALVDCLLSTDSDSINYDPKVVKVALSALDGIDKQVLGLKRLEVDNKSADNDRQMAAILSQIANQRMREHGDPFKVANTTPDAPPRVIAPPPEVVGEFDFMPEETQVKRSNGSYHEFIERMDPIMAEEKA
jgi:hypothetical protein